MKLSLKTTCVLLIFALLASCVAATENKDIPTKEEITDFIAGIPVSDNYIITVFDAVKDLKLVIFSGDLDNCSFADKLVEKEFSSKIFFSQSEKYPQEELDNLPKYVGKVIGNNYNGAITLDMTE